MLVLASIGLTQPPESIGKVAALEGKAYVLHQGHTTSEHLAVGSPLYQEDVIQTEAASKIKLTFVDGTVLNLGENGLLKISKFVYAPEQKIQSSIFTISHGVFRAVMANLLPRSRLEVTTHTAVAAIRGTDWMGEVTRDSSAFVALQGRVDSIYNANPAVHGRVHLNDGWGTTVKVNQSPTRPTKWGEARVNALLKATALP